MDPSETHQSQSSQSNPGYLRLSQSLSQNRLSLTRLSQTRLSQPSSSPPHIPGPAGVVQGATHQRTLDRQAPLTSRDTPISTQEYIRRAFEDPVEDQDFKKRPWLSAMEFLNAEGTYYPLSSINKMYLEKVDQVVVVVKSCKPNGLGDLWLTLKDPTATIEASVHKRVLTENPFGIDIAVGSVLILHKIAVFAKNPRSARIFNTTLPNLYIVFRKY